MSTFVDTSALLTVLDASDVAHRAADRTWRRLIESDRQLVSTNYLLFETFALVQSRLGLPAVRVLANDVVPLLQSEWLSAADHEAAVKAVLSANRRSKLSLVDCTSFRCMRGLGLKQALAGGELEIAAHLGCSRTRLRVKASAGVADAALPRRRPQSIPRRAKRSTGWDPRDSRHRTECIGGHCVTVPAPSGREARGVGSEPGVGCVGAGGGN